MDALKPFSKNYVETAFAERLAAVAAKAAA